MSTSLFFDYPCSSKGESEQAAVATDLAWCKSENLLACALDSGRVAIYQDEVWCTGIGISTRSRDIPQSLPHQMSEATYCNVLCCTVLYLLV